MSILLAFGITQRCMLREMENHEIRSLNRASRVSDARVPSRVSALLGFESARGRLQFRPFFPARKLRVRPLRFIFVRLYGIPRVICVAFNATTSAAVVKRRLTLREQSRPFASGEHRARACSFCLAGYPAADFPRYCDSLSLSKPLRGQSPGPKTVVLKLEL